MNWGLGFIRASGFRVEGLGLLGMSWSRVSGLELRVPYLTDTKKMT